MESVRERLIKIFDDNGMIILEEDIELPLEIDSIQFISIVVQIEDEFNVTIPDDYLVSSVLLTFLDFEQLLLKLGL